MAASRKGGLFALSRPPAAAAEEDDDDIDLDDFGEDLELDEPAGGSLPDIGGGPFDDYAATALDPEADPASRADALRQAILTVLEERGR